MGKKFITEQLLYNIADDLDINIIFNLTNILNFKRRKNIMMVTKIKKLLCKINWFNKHFLLSILICGFIFFMLINIASCEQKNENKIKSEKDDIIISDDRDIKLSQSKDKLIPLDINGDSLFYINNEKLLKYNLSSSEETVIFDGLTSAESIYVMSGRIYIFDSEKNNVIEYDDKFNITNEFILTEKIGVAEKLIKLGDTILILFKTEGNNYGNKIYKINLKDNTQGYLNIKGQMFINDILFMDEDNILIIHFNMVGSVQLTKYNIPEDKKEFTTDDTRSSNAYFDIKSGHIYLLGISGTSMENPYANIEITQAEIIDGKLNILSSKKINNPNPNPELVSKFYINDSGFILFYEDNFIAVRKFTEDKNKILNIYQFGTGHPWFENSVRGFQKDYGVEINVSSHDDYTFEKIKIKLLANDTDFDLFMIDTYSGIDVFNKGAYEPLDSYPGLMKNISEMYPGMQKLLNYNGKTIGIPTQQVTSLAFAFNDKLAEKYDLIQPEIENGIWTIDEFYEYAKYIKEKSGGEAYLFASNDADSLMTGWILQAYLTAFCNPQTNELTDNGDNLKKIILWCKKIADEELFYETNGSWDYDNVLLGWPRSYNMICDETLIPIPVFNKNAKIPVGFWMLCINKYSPNKELAAQFLEYMTSEKHRYDRMTPILYDALDKYECYKLYSDMASALGLEREYSYPGDEPAEKLEFTDRMRYNAKYINTLYENAILEARFGDVKVYEFIWEMFSKYLKGEISIDTVTNDIYNKLKMVMNG